MSPYKILLLALLLGACSLPEGQGEETPYPFERKNENSLSLIHDGKTGYQITGSFSVRGSLSK